MTDADSKVILERLTHIQEDVGEIKADVKAINGCVRIHSRTIAVLKDHDKSRTKWFGIIAVALVGVGGKLLYDYLSH